MTFSKALSLRPVRRQAMFRVCALGIALALANGSLMAAPTGVMPDMTGQVQAPASIAVSKIDFKRGDDGAGHHLVRRLRHLQQSGITDLCVYGFTEKRLVPLLLRWCSCGGYCA